jgi:hypothetical protein
MHLAYLDDSDTKTKLHKWQVMSCIFIEDKSFKLIEAGLSAIPEELIGAERLHEFDEFHASELYGGYGIFENIDQDKRFAAIERLLHIISALGIRIVYGAVDLDKMKHELFGSADPLDICFRICLKGIDVWSEGRLHERIDAEAGEDRDKWQKVILKNLIEELVVLIVDDCDAKVKSILTRTFRAIRPSSLTSGYNVHCLHDDLYFGDSRFSIGIQLADLCSYFIGKHLEGDVESEGFFQMIEPNIRYWQSFPSQETFNSMKIVQPASQLEMLQLGMENKPIESGDTNESQLGTTEVQSSDGGDPSGRSESSEGSDGSGETSERTEAEG